jgi:broad specificity phosphatase PhoE
MYEEQYQTIDESDLSYVKLIDIRTQIVANRITGYLPTRILPFILNLHLTPRPIWLSRHGESEDNRKGRIGGDAALSPMGERYAEALARLIESDLAAEGGLQVFTSTRQRATQTAQRLSSSYRSTKALDEIDSGLRNGMTYEQIKKEYPDEYALRTQDKFNYRYPQGESYADVIQRVEPLLVEIARQQEAVVVIGHQAVLRTLYGYFRGEPPERCPLYPIPLHTVIQLEPRGYDFQERRVEWDIEAGWRETSRLLLKLRTD